MGMKKQKKYKMHEFFEDICANWPHAEPVRAKDKWANWPFDDKVN